MREDAATRGSVRRVVVALAFATIVVAWLGRSVDSSAWLTADGLRAFVHAGAWYAPLAYVATIVVAMFLPIPKIVLLGLGGVLFGPWYGFAYAWLGQVLGMTALFVLARTGLRKLARRVLLEHRDAARRIDEQLAVHGLAVVASLRLLYVMGTPLSILLSTTRVRLAQFVGGTAVGVVPAIALAVVAGDSAAAGATGPKAAVIGIAALLVIGGGAIVRRRFRV